VAPKVKGVQNVATNRRARFEYEIIETWEAGIMLTGTEVKSLRDAKCTLGDGYIFVRDHEAFLANVHIPEYTHGNRNNHEPKRTRKLLLHPNEIEKIRTGIERAGHTCIPLEIYFSNGFAKVQIALARGKKDVDKRNTERDREDRREMRQFSARG
jgi:SsrA-binding protein